MRPDGGQEELVRTESREDEVLRVYAARDAFAAVRGHGLERIYADLKRREAGSRLRRVKARPLVRA